MTEATMRTKKRKHAGYRLDMKHPETGKFVKIGDYKDGQGATIRNNNPFTAEYRLRNSQMRLTFFNLEPGQAAAVVGLSFTIVEEEEAPVVEAGGEQVVEEAA